MRVLHSYCLNFNIGDYALGIGVKNILRNNLDIELIGDTNLQGRVFDKYYINEVINKRYDLLVIGGGGIIHGAHWPNGWFWLIERELIKEIKIPFVVYGVGYNYWVEEGGIPERGIEHLKETIKHAASFSVRNDGSADRLLEQTGIVAPVVPDPGFHVDLNTKYDRIVNEPYVLIQLANDKPERRYGNIQKKERFILEMREIIQELSLKYKVILAPHVVDDIQISKDVCQGIENTEVWDFGYFAFDHSEIAVGYYKYAEYVIAMRGHGQILPICFNTPVISLENHPKHRGLMKNLGLLDYNVKVNNEDFLSSLRNSIELLELNKMKIIEQYKVINKTLLISTNDAFQKIIKNIL